MKIINDEKLNEAIENGNKTLVLFSAEWCGPCKIIKPALEKLESELTTGIDIVKADVSEASEGTKKFNIKNIPTCVLLDGGKEIARFSGVKTDEQIKKFLEDHLVLN